MDTEENNLSKKYYSIGEVAKILNVNTSLIRFWETEFAHIKPKKNRKGNRVFTKEEIEKLKFVYYLVKERGLKLDGAKKIIKEQRGREKERYHMIESLYDLKRFLITLKEELSQEK